MKSYPSAKADTLAFWNPPNDLLVAIDPLKIETSF